MKKNIFLLFLSVFALFFSCNDDSGTRFETRIVANAILENKDVVRASVSVESERPINESGKIYTYVKYKDTNRVRTSRFTMLSPCRGNWSGQDSFYLL